MIDVETSSMVNTIHQFLTAMQYGSDVGVVEMTVTGPIYDRLLAWLNQGWPAGEPSDPGSPILRFNRTRILRES